jgi:hypothetical protein
LDLDSPIPHALQEVLLRIEIGKKPIIFNVFHTISAFDKTVDSGENG